MPEEIKEQQSNEKALGADKETDNNQYIQALNELKAKSVDKAEYDKLKAENEKLLDSIVNGRELNLPSEEEKSHSIQELRNELFNKEHTNLEYCKTALELRKSILDEGGVDPFLPYGSKIAPTNEDIECANRVAQVLQEAIDYADGDSALFTQEIQRRMIDTGPKQHSKR